MVITKENILDFLSSHKSELRKRFGVRSIALFGSYAREEATDESDIDILVDMPSSFEAFFGLKHYLETQLHKPVDLGMEKKMRSFIRHHIDEEIIYV
ncbi:PAP/25A core domain:DNA polymerase, beta-like region [Hydrogenimonas sp.]|nr:PAP/25A core domain:DNA polymerase, beta-like region [Hydrogenimonas sp.]